MIYLILLYISQIIKIAVTFFNSFNINHFFNHLDLIYIENYTITKQIIIFMKYKNNLRKYKI